MSEPERLASGEDLRGELLRSARADRTPHAAVKARHVATVVATAAALQGRAAAAASVKALLAKAALVSTLALIAVGAIRYAAPEPRALDRVQREVRTTPTAPTPLVLETSERAAPAVPIVSVAELPPAAPLPAAASERLAEEVARLDRAREAVQRGAGQRALAELARYHRDFPAAQLAQEATLVEIDALEASGQHDHARALARTFMRAHPQTAASRRLATVYEE